MKIKKTAALLLALVLAFGAAAGCAGNGNAGETTAGTTAAASSEPTASQSELPVGTSESSVRTTVPADIQAPAADVKDEDTTPIVIYSWNHDFKDLLDTYYVPGHPGFQYEYHVVDESRYQAVLESVLSSDAAAPDIFLADGDYAKKYVDTADTLNINMLGISNAELKDQYAYTYSSMMSAEGAVKAVAWAVNPCGVIYNRSLAKTYLGTDDPAAVGEYFATWDDFLGLAEKLNQLSGGAVKAVSGIDDIWRSWLNRRTNAWIEDGNVKVEPVMEAFFDYAKKFEDEGLTAGTAQGSEQWKANMANSGVFSYWGSVDFLRTQMGFGFESDNSTVRSGANPTTGGWGLCAAPDSFTRGDTYIFASSSDNNRATTADIMRFFCMDGNTASAMAAAGVFVNSVTVMTDLSDDPSWSMPYLSGQNPLPVLLPAAAKQKASLLTAYDQNIGEIFQKTAAAYSGGKLLSAEDATEVFLSACADAGIGNY